MTPGRARPVGTIAHEARRRETGATVRVERSGPGSWIEEEYGWVTVCLNHATCVLHYTLVDARSHAPYPSGWCEPCREITEGKAPRITGRYQYDRPLCQMCGERQAEWNYDPYRYELYPEDGYDALLCDPCFQERKDDI